MSRLYMMAAITSRSARKKFREFYKTHEQQVFFEILGKGTANSEVLNYFGLEETEKILFLSIVTGDTWKRLKRGLIIDMKIDVKVDVKIDLAKVIMALTSAMVMLWALV